jgi:hypothetical protein
MIKYISWNAGSDSATQQIPCTYRTFITVFTKATLFWVTWNNTTSTGLLPVLPMVRYPKSSYLLLFRHKFCTPNVLPFLKVKVNLPHCFKWAPHHEYVLGEWRHISTFHALTLALSGSGQLDVPATLPPAEEPLVPTEQVAGWAPEPVWIRWWREKFPAPAGIRTPNQPANSPALYRSSLLTFIKLL